MNQQQSIKACRISGKQAEHAEIAAAIERRQRKHKRVTVMQARLTEVAHEILKLEVR